MTTSPRNQAQSAQLQRLQREAERQQQRINNPARPARQGPNGSVIPLGGDAANPIRSFIGGTSGGTAEGSPVTLSSGGVVGGMPRGVEVTSQQLRALEEKAAKVDFTAGLQVIAANPNDLDGDGSDRQKLARRPGDCCLDTSTGVWYYWNATEKLWLGETIPVSVPIQGASVQQYPVLFAWCRLRIETLSIQNKDSSGANVTDGTATLLANGGAVTLGTTLLPLGGYLALNVTGAGSDFLVASITVVPV
jgi:hypothetical protein